MKAVRVPDSEEAGVAAGETSHHDSEVLYHVGKHQAESERPSFDHLQVLVAEDDPINSKIIKKRLEKLEHTVILTVNGEECATAIREKPGSFDVVLMDMQVSIRAVFLCESVIDLLCRCPLLMALPPPR